MNTLIYLLVAVLVFNNVECDEQENFDEPMLSFDMYLPTFLYTYYNQFENLSPDEKVEKFVKDVIPQIDENNDQKITLDELTAWFAKTVENEAYETYHEHLNFTNIDANSDGKLSLAEVTTHFKENLNTANEESEDNFTGRQVQKEVVRFHYADKNEDGFLSKDEVPKFVLAEHFEDSKNLFVTIFKLDHDSNGDGTITKTEYVRNNHNDPNFQSEEEIELNFADYDKNKDGVLSDEEITKAGEDYQNMLNMHGDLERIFYLAVENGSDVVTYDQLAAVSRFLTNKYEKLPLDQALNEEDGNRVHGEL